MEAGILTSPMLVSRRQLHALSRDPAMLTRAVVLTAIVFILSAIWIGATRPPGLTAMVLTTPPSSSLDVLLKSDTPDRTALLRTLRDLAEKERRRRFNDDPINEVYQPDPNAAHRLPTQLAASRLPAEEQAAFLAWHEAVRTGEVPQELILRLESLQMPAAPGLPRTMAADLKRISRDYQGALAAYEAAGVDPANTEARRRAVALALSRDWQAVIDRLLAKPPYYDAVHALHDEISDRLAREQRDLPLLFRRTLDIMLSGFRHIDYAMLSLLTAAVWFVSLHKACRLPHRQWWLGLACLPLGMGSTVIAVVLQGLQESRQGLNDSELAGPALLFQIASVGLREEFSKLLCFLPPALLLLRRGTPAQAFMAASSVGLGFALEENIIYYLNYGGAAVLARFVTATFMHIAMTGLCGLALFKFLRYPKNFGPLFLATFTGMVLLHGFYNFSQGGFDNPFSRELSGLFPFIIAGLAWYYFQTIRQEQEAAPQPLSAEAVFLLGTTIVMGTLLNYLVHENGWAAAVSAFIPAALSSILFCWLFHHFLRNA